MRINTPFGDDEFILTINEDNSCIFDSLLDAYQVSSDSVDINSDLCVITFTTNTPISALIRIEISAGRDNNSIADGWVHIGDYVKTSFTASRMDV